MEPMPQLVATLEDADPYYEQALAIVAGEAEPTHAVLQSALLIGFNRASRLMDRLIADGVVYREPTPEGMAYRRSDPQVVRVLRSGQRHSPLYFSDAFNRYLHTAAPEVLDYLEPALFESLHQDDVETAAEHPSWLDEFGGDPLRYTLERYHFTQLPSGQVVLPHSDMTRVRTHPLVLDYVVQHGAAAFSNPEVPFVVQAVAKNVFAGVGEADDGSEYVYEVHPRFAGAKVNC